MDRNDAIPQHGILARAPRRAASRPRMIAAGGDAQNTAHRGHRMNGPVLAHESVSFGGTVFVSRANQAAARERMSRSTLSWRFSRRKRWSSWRSAEVNPSARRPSSRSACATQLRIVCAVGSNSRSNSSGVRPARTRSTICRRNSGGYGARFLPLLGIADSFDTNPAVSTKPGQLQMTSRLEHDQLDEAWRAAATPLSVIELGLLHADEAAALAAPFLAANAAAANRCVERAAGNPLFLEQL